MTLFKDLTGKRFGKLTVIKKVEKPINSTREGFFWLCKCDCGNEKIVCGKELGFYTNSCGCIRREHPSNYKDLVGKRFGKLIIIKRVPDKI